ncbi:V-type ATP synthase subunit F [Thermogladius calderae 1633]|uniref:V-type ATP synthase subunit F n=1 Tax=Thermogladius calderae (strain DSM 22663 / VKM B-2946 / 1633) TaxID=1184251 RepID=I3TFL6_THEC1|nr:V-type ATP synthase subunit F [Thermogladius calderae 1633]
MVVSRKDHEHFYRLIGFKNVVVATKEEVWRLLSELKNDKHTAAILVEESLAREAGLDVLALNEKGFGPVVTLVPDKEVFLQSDPKAYYLKFASRIVGYQLGV